MAETHFSQKPRLAFLDVGHGNCTVLIDTEGVVVVDAGSGTALLEFLLQEGLDRVDVLLISHADSDHIGGVIAVLSCEEITVECVRLNSDALKKSALWDDLTYLLDQRHQTGELDFDVSLTTKDSGVFGQGSVNVEILAPSLYLAAKSPGSTDRQGRRITSNSMSAVVKLTMNGKPIALLPGDMDKTGLDNLSEGEGDPRAPLSIFPHHGGKPGATDPGEFAKQFCETVSPEALVFSIGRGLHGTPRPEVISSVRQALPNTWILCTQLSEHCAPGLPDSEPSHLTDVFARGREARKCCAGTILVSLSDKGIDVKPKRSEHCAFVRKAAPNTSLCLK